VVRIVRVAQCSGQRAIASRKTAYYFMSVLDWQVRFVFAVFTCAERIR